MLPLIGAGVLAGIAINLIASALTAPIAGLAASTIYFGLIGLRGDTAAAPPPVDPDATPSAT